VSEFVNIHVAFSVDNLAVDKNLDFSSIFLKHFCSDEDSPDNPYVSGP